MKSLKLPLLAASFAALTTSAQQPAATPASAPAPAASVYAETGAGKFSPAVKDHLERIYVPNLRSNDVYVIDPASNKVVDKFKVGIGPQHVVPSWDLKTL